MFWPYTLIETQFTKIKHVWILSWSHMSCSHCVRYFQVQCSGFRIAFSQNVSLCLHAVNRRESSRGGRITIASFCALGRTRQLSCGVESNNYHSSSTNKIAKSLKTTAHKHLIFAEIDQIQLIWITLGTERKHFKLWKAIWLSLCQMSVWKRAWLACKHFMETDFYFPTRTLNCQTQLSVSTPLVSIKDLLHHRPKNQQSLCRKQPETE